MRPERGRLGGRGRRIAPESTEHRGAGSRDRRSRRLVFVETARKFPQIRAKRRRSRLRIAGPVGQLRAFVQGPVVRTDVLVGDQFSLPPHPAPAVPGICMGRTVLLTRRAVTTARAPPCRPTSRARAQSDRAVKSNQPGAGSRDWWTSYPSAGDGLDPSAGGRRTGTVRAPRDRRARHVSRLPADRVGAKLRLSIEHAGLAERYRTTEALGKQFDEGVGEQLMGEGERGGADTAGR